MRKSATELPKPLAKDAQENSKISSFEVRCNVAEQPSSMASSVSGFAEGALRCESDGAKDREIRRATHLSHPASRCHQPDLEAPGSCRHAWTSLP